MLKVDWALLIAAFATVAAYVGHYFTFRSVTRQIAAQLAISKKQFTVDILSRSRQARLDNLRHEISSYLAATDAIWRRSTLPSDTMNAENKQKSLYHKLQVNLFLDPHNQLHAELIRHLDEATLLVINNGDYHAFGDLLTRIIHVSQQVLGEEQRNISDEVETEWTNPTTRCTKAQRVL